MQVRIPALHKFNSLSEKIENLCFTTVKKNIVKTPVRQYFCGDGLATSQKSSPHINNGARKIVENVIKCSGTYLKLSTICHDIPLVHLLRLSVTTRKICVRKPDFKIQIGKCLGTYLLIKTNKYLLRFNAVQILNCELLSQFIQNPIDKSRFSFFSKMKIFQENFPILITTYYLGRQEHLK